ncbi:hypothetical protein [Brevibacillus borstelensis]|uniref:hypothetical protein n=1 Tax=Brevibacillus borstelensis TaxID=45462 RepID=UPI0030C2B1FE
MGVPFESFASQLTEQQVSLLADTVQYFADAPKLLSIPDEQGNRVSVPILPETMGSLLAVFPKGAETEKLTFGFRWESGEDEGVGTLVIALPDGTKLRQPTVLSQFSPV